MTTAHHDYKRFFDNRKLDGEAVVCSSFPNTQSFQLGHEITLSGRACLECTHYGNKMTEITLLQVHSSAASKLGCLKEDSEKTSSGSEKDNEKKPIRHDFFVYSLHAVPGRGARAPGSVVKGSCYYFQYIDMSSNRVMTQEEADKRGRDLTYKEKKWCKYEFFTREDTKVCDGQESRHNLASVFGRASISHQSTQPRQPPSALQSTCQVDPYDDDFSMSKSRDSLPPSNASPVNSTNSDDIIISEDSTYTSYQMEDSGSGTGSK